MDEQSLEQEVETETENTPFDKLSRILEEIEKAARVQADRQRIMKLTLDMSSCYYSEEFQRYLTAYSEISGAIPEGTELGDGIRINRDRYGTFEASCNAVVETVREKPIDYVGIVQSAQKTRIILEHMKREVPAIEKYCLERNLPI